jgi:hypothetical protein
LSENVILLRRSKEAADQDRKERGIEFDDYLEAMDQDVYNDDVGISSKGYLARDIKQGISSKGY